MMRVIGHHKNLLLVGLDTLYPKLHRATDQAKDLFRLHMIMIAPFYALFVKGDKIDLSEGEVVLRKEVLRDKLDEISPSDRSILSPLTKRA